MNARHLLVPGRALHLPGGQLCPIVTRRRDVVIELSERRIQPVAGRPRLSWGLCEMPGNVFEWRTDLFDHYPPGSRSPRPAAPPEGADHVLRGGL